MAKQVHPDVLDGGLNQIKNNAVKMLLLSNFTFGDSFATVTANTLASVAMVPGDFTLGTSGTSRTLTTATKTANATAGVTGGNLHIAFTDGSSKVLLVTDETTDQAITSGNPIDFPAIVHTNNQPT